jgi:GDPmannose 4,6-dehydratase
MTVLLTGVGGQAGRWLTDILLSKGFEVVGTVRRSSQPRDYLNDYIKRGLKVVEADNTDYSSMDRLIRELKPSHLFNLAAQSHVKSSFDQPIYTWQCDAESVLNLLEIIRNSSPSTKLIQASSSEMFGKSVSRRMQPDLSGIEYYQDEETLLVPQSPYSIAKLAAHHAVRLYRESYGLFASSCIMFNYESELRSLTFVTRKITNYVSRLKLAKEVGKEIEPLILGNLEAKRDWSHAHDTMTGMFKLGFADKPMDVVIGSGETHSVREFAQLAFEYIGEHYLQYVQISKEFMRPAEVDYLCSDPSKAKKELGWESTISFSGLIKRMIDNDIERTNKKYTMYGDI